MHDHTTKAERAGRREVDLAAHQAGDLAEARFTDYRRKPLGPYDHSAKYRDAEPIAERQGWLEIRGASLEKGPAAHKVHAYAIRYIRSPELALRIVDVLAPLSDAELETWANG